MELSYKLDGGWNDVFLSEPHVKSAVIKTLAYAAVFNYPLTSEEIYKYLFLRVQQDSDKENCYSDTYHCSITNQIIEGALYELLLSRKVEEKKGYYFLRGMGSSVAQRNERLQISLKKLARAENFKNWARSIPTVKLIGVSGALAMSNAHEEDDIDLFIVARSGTVWLTRFLTVLLAEILGVRRRPDQYITPGDLFHKTPSVIRDKICLNMFVDESHMAVPPNERDLFSAHEVVQMKPIYDKDNTYIKFIGVNEWARNYLPNAIQKCNPEPEQARYRAGAQSTKRKTSTQNLKLKLRITHYVLRITEFFAKGLQLFYMRNKVTNEVLNIGYLRFHPVDARKIVLRRYKQILANLP